VLTRAGWGVLLGSMALLATGRLLGIFELFILGAGAAALVVAALVGANVVRLRLDVSRELRPPRVHAGGASRVELRVRNRATRRTPPLVFHDPVGGAASAEVLVGPLGPGEELRAAYRLPTERRGILTVGPLMVEVGDPFGLASAATEGAERTELTVYPPIETVVPVPHTLGDDPHAGADHPNTLSATGEDFYALRRYEMGDDLRRVHWRATARHDDLMVRQDEMPWQGRATVLLDVRSSSHSEASFEQAVSAAASIVVACQRSRFLLRLLTSDGRDTGVAAGQAHVETILERLATVQPSRSARLQGVVTSLRRGGQGGALVALLGARAASGDIDALARAGRRFGHTTVVLLGAGRDTRSGTNTVVVHEGERFADAWNAAMRPRHRRGGVVTR